MSQQVFIALFLALAFHKVNLTRDIFLGQRKYGGPPPNWDGPSPGNGCEVFCGKIPKDMYEDELIPLFEKCGMIWDLRLMMDPMTGTNRGYAFITFTSRDSAYNSVREVSEAFSSEPLFFFTSRHIFRFRFFNFLLFSYIT